MSFSSDLKKELGKMNNLADKKQVRCEFLGYLISYNTHIVNSKTIRYATESDYNINRFSKLLDNLQIEYRIEVEGNLFVVTFKTKDVPEVKIENNFIILNQESTHSFERDEDKKAFIRGAFLGSGSVNNPENNYHLEIVFSNIYDTNSMKKIIEEFEIKIKILEKESKFSLYIKEGEEISRLLALMGANKGVLEFEDIRIKKEMRGKINRLVNCETANLTKTINASVEQIEAINRLKKQGRFEKLNENLKEIANLRLENPDLSYEELGNKLKVPLGKSGVNYRLKKIIEISRDL